MANVSEQRAVPRLSHSMEVPVTVHSDVACPWCAIGNLNLRKALAQVAPDVTFKIHYVPYILHPEVPQEGIRKSPAAMFGTRLKAAADEAGIRFANDGYVSNTVDANRLIWFAGQHGERQWSRYLHRPPLQQLGALSGCGRCGIQLVTALFRMYFEEGADVGQRSVLEAAATEAGLNLEAVRQLLDSDEGRGDVIAATRSARAANITGVPHYIFGEQQYALTGGQPVAVFVQVLNALARQARQAPKGATEPARL